MVSVKNVTMGLNRRQFMKDISAIPAGDTLLAGCLGDGEPDVEAESGEELFPDRELNLAVAGATNSTIDQHQTSRIQNRAAITLTYERLIDRDVDENIQLIVY